MKLNMAQIVTFSIEFIDYNGENSAGGFTVLNFIEFELQTNPSRIIFSLSETMRSSSYRRISLQIIIICQITKMHNNSHTVIRNEENVYGIV